jgi:hypothetical protein
MKQSSYGKINVSDLLKGFLIAFLTASLTGLIETLELGSLPSLASMKVHAIAGLVAGLSYLIKNFLTNTNGDLLKKESTTEPEGDGVGGRPVDRNKP